MGYTTTFTGELKFTRELTASELAKVKSFFLEDVREHPDWLTKADEGTYVSYIDLKFTDDFSGIQWDDETEKNAGMVEAVNIIIREMRKTSPDFGLEGGLLAQGEIYDDRWQLYIGNDGFAHKKDVVILGNKVTCPHCGQNFVVEEVSE